jgi:hypothetical protein
MKIILSIQINNLNFKNEESIHSKGEIRAMHSTLVQLFKLHKLFFFEFI